MVYEVIPTKFDVARLRDHLQKHVVSLEPVMQSSSFGGWSVLSSDRSYQDGWFMGHKVIGRDTPAEELSKKLKELGAKPATEYVYPTEICTDYLLEVIEEIRRMGFAPKRARIIRLTAGLASSWHRDCPEYRQFVRLHVPIITNPGCFFETEEERAHMSANGQSYLVKVNRMHRVVNHGDTDRFHLVMDVVDHNHVSQFHRPVSS